MSSWHYIYKRYGMKIKLEFPPKTISVGTTPTKILNVNGDRMFVLIINNGDYIVYVGPHSDVSTTKGIPIDANGGAFQSDVDNDGDLTLHEWWAVSETGTNPLYILAIEGEKIG